MAESHEENKGLLAGALLQIYMELRDTLLSLPIPLAIPTTVEAIETPLAPVMRSVHRAAKVAEDEPLPTAIIAVLIDVLNLWNVAALTTSVALRNEGDLFVDAAGTALAHADSALQLLIELLTDLPGAEE